LELPFKIAVFTGRTFGEAQVGLSLVGIDGWVDTANMITWNDGMTKPDGRPLDILTKRLDSKAAAFIGDNRDDMRSVHMYRENGDREVLSVQVCFGASAETARQAFIDGGADMITTTTTDALTAINCLWEGDQ
jgi:phosphoglycolate phosphatase-like HAD superfamily hydrolase